MAFQMPFRISRGLSGVVSVLKNQLRDKIQSLYACLELSKGTVLLPLTLIEAFVRKSGFLYCLTEDEVILFPVF